MNSSDTLWSLLAAHPIPLWVYDLDTLEFLEVNDTAVEAYGYTRDEFLRRRIFDIRPPDEIPRLIHNVMEERTPVQQSGEWRHRLKNGRVIAVEITSHALEFRGRRAALVFARDVTLRKEVDHLRALLGSLATSTECAIFSTSLNGTILSWSPGAERLYGYSAGEAVGAPASIIMPPDVQGDASAMISAVSAGRSVAGYEARRQRKDGRIVHVSVTVSPMRDQSGLVLGAAAIHCDLTDRKAAEERERLVLKEIEEARMRVFRATMRTVQDIVGNFVSVVHGLTELSEDELPADYRKAVYGAVNRATSRLRALGAVDAVRETPMAVGFGVEYPVGDGQAERFALSGRVSAGA